MCIYFPDFRTPSQDSITRTKNPVLPSIHTETCLVVPEPNIVKYPGQGAGGQHMLSGHTLLFAGKKNLKNLIESVEVS